VEIKWSESRVCECTACESEGDRLGDQYVRVRDETGRGPCPDSGGYDFDAEATLRLDLS
jgi:hypothetical protein